MALFLEITENTLAKLRPQLAIDLMPEQTQALAKGTSLELQSYAYADEGGRFNGHIKFAIAREEDWLQNLNTWYVYEGHAQVVNNGEVVYPPPAAEEPNIQFALRITRDTYFKREPEQSVDLAPEQLYRVSRGEAFALESYAYGTPERDFNGHIKFTLEDQDIEGFNTWYVYEGHAQVLANGKIVYPEVEHEHPQVLKVTQSTYIKRRPEQVTDLPPEAIYRVYTGAEYDILAYAVPENRSDLNGHVKFTLRPEENAIRGFNTWFIFNEFAEVYYDGELVYPQPPPAPTPPVERGPSIRLPGYASAFYLRESILPGGNFTWSEATKGGSRIPSTKGVVNNILALASRLETARAQVGRPFVVTSWYRDTVTNRMVGGAKYSRHVYGQAVDFYVPGLSTTRVATILSDWPGGLGWYPTWIHLDTGPRRRWYR